MGTKSNPSEYDCYANAHEDEPLFVLLGRDKFAGALVRIWAEMREREGEDALVVAEARKCADELEKYAADLGKPVISLDAIISFATMMRGMKETRDAIYPQKEQPPEIVWREGEYACTIHSADIGIFEKIIYIEDKPTLGVVRFSPTLAPSIPLASLRKPLQEEIEAYYTRRGGR